MRRKIGVLLFIGLFVASGWLLLFRTAWENRPVPADARQLIRFHVLANSDREEDQQVKLKVRDAVVSYLAPFLDNAADIEDARNIIAARQGEIINIAGQVLRDNGMDYGAGLQIGYFDFPIKSYGSFVLPAGRYEAVRLLLGNGEGKNWWCVLFPPLCFIDISSATAVPKGENGDSSELQPDKIELRWKIIELFKQQ